jgi:hypothetical protein
MTTTDITPYAAEPLDERIKYAQVLARASLIPKSLWDSNRNDENGRLVLGGPSVGNVLLVMEHGAMLGLHPMAAINGIYIIEGKASMSANLMSAVVRAKGFKLRVVTEGDWGPGFKATASIVRPDDPDFTYSVTWTEAKAKRAELTGKDNWKKYPEAMAKARAISEVIREGATDALNGLVYTPEEIGANVNESGDYEPENVGDLTPATAPPAAPSAKPAARKQATNGTQGTRKAKPAEKAPEPTPEPVAEPVADEPAAVPADEPAPPAEPDVAAIIAEQDKNVEALDAYLAGTAERNSARKAEQAATAAPPVPVADPNVIDAEPIEDDDAEKLEKAQREWEAAEQMRMVAETDAADEAAKLANLAAEVDAGIAAEDAAFGQPESWFVQLERAATVADCAAIWNGADNARELDSDLRIAIVKHKDALIAASA